MDMSVTSRVFRDMHDGVIALDLHGRVLYINRRARQMLEKSEDITGESYAAVFMTENGKNDDFHQLILDAIYCKERTHSGQAEYETDSGALKTFALTTSFLKDEGESENIGVVAIISDVTEEARLRRRSRDATVVMVSVLACLCVYFLFWRGLDFFGVRIDTKILTQIIHLLVLAVAVIVFRLTGLSLAKDRLKLQNPAKTLSVAALTALAVVAVMALAKALLVGTPNGEPFWNWDIGVYTYFTYFLTCLIQEFLARVVVYESFVMILDGKRAETSAVIMSALLVGMMHIAHGFVYMLGSIALIWGLGGLYKKQGNIWGVAVIHYAFGIAGSCLGLI